jgi:hypothetical protein
VVLLIIPEHGKKPFTALILTIFVGLDVEIADFAFEGDGRLDGLFQAHDRPRLSLRIEMQSGNLKLKMETGSVPPETRRHP